MSARLDGDLMPGVDHRLLLDAAGAVAVPGVGDGAAGEGGKARRALEALVADRVVPDLPRFDPGVAAEGGGDEVEGVVGDAGIEVDAAIVLAGMHVARHRRRL